MRSADPLPPILRSPAFSTRAAQDAGVSSERLRRRDLAKPHHGARIPDDDRDGSLLMECRAYRAVMPASQCFSHATAAGIHGLSLPSRCAGGLPLHVGTIAGGRAPRGANVVGHKLALTQDEVIRVRGMPVPRVEEVWVQLAGHLSVTELVVAGDSCIRRTSPLTDLTSLRLAVQGAAKRQGIARLREALELVRARTDSPMESVLRLLLNDAGLPEPAVNLPIAIGNGVVLHGDLAYPRHRLIVEYDGDHHRTDRRQYDHDIDRVWALQRAGWRVLRLNKSHLAGQATRAIERVSDALMHSRGRT